MKRGRWLVVCVGALFGLMCMFSLTPTSEVGANATAIQVKKAVVIHETAEVRVTYQAGTSTKSITKLLIPEVPLKHGATIAQVRICGVTKSVRLQEPFALPAYTRFEQSLTSMKRQLAKGNIEGSEAHLRQAKQRYTQLPTTQVSVATRNQAKKMLAQAEESLRNGGQIQSTLAQQMLDCVNRERKKAGVSLLKLDEKASKADRKSVV